MHQTVFIIHGVQGHPKENWFPWLKKELELIGCRVIAHRFPNPESPQLSEWSEFFGKYKVYFNNNTIVIGHSLGVAFLLNILEKYPAKTAFFVAGFCSDPKNEFSESMGAFTNRDFDWETIKGNCHKFFIYSSDNDPYVSLPKGKELAEKLNSKIKIVKNAGHFNEASGCKKFELLLNDIKNSIAKDL